MKQSENNFKSDEQFESDSHFDSSLARHYQRSKSDAKAPTGIKQNVMLKATREDKDKQFGVSWQGLSQLAFAASICMFVFLLLTPNQPENSLQLANRNIIEFHTIDGTPANSQMTSRASINIAYAKLEQEYARNTLLIAGVQRQAKLKINGDGSWQLNTCEQHDLLLSGELVAMFDKYQLLPDLAQSGMVVNIGFDNKGHIIQIEASQSSMLC